MPIHLVRKLEQFAWLSDGDRRALEQLASLKVRRLGAKEDLIREGDQPRHVHLILEGWACRYKVLEDGRRQIAAFLVPGDICDLRMFIIKQMDHSLGSMTPIRVAEIPSDMLLDLTQNHPQVVRALWWNSLVEEAIAREWIVNNSQRDATERVAHLFCELFIRLRAVGLSNGHTCEFPLTQAELGETTGLSTVHINRTLQDLRADSLIMLKGKTLTIPSLERLQKAAMFNANYLHLERDGRDFDEDHQAIRRPA